MIAVEIDSSQMIRMQEAVKRAGKNIAREVAAAINKMAKKTRLDMGREVKKHIAVKKAEAEKPISVVSIATAMKMQALVKLKKTKRLGLRHFAARQDNRGVSYKISKKGGRARVDGAFQGPKPGVMKTSWKGNVFKRLGKAVRAGKGRYQGKLRQPIVQVHGVSVFGAYSINKLAGPQAKAVFDELHYQIERRINLNILKAEGLVKS